MHFIFLYSISLKLCQTANLLCALQRVQNSRLSLATLAAAPHVIPATPEEIEMSEQIIQNLTQLTMLAKPENVVSAEAVRKAMGVDLGAFPCSLPKKIYTCEAHKTGETESVQENGSGVDFINGK